MFQDWIDTITDLCSKRETVARPMLFAVLTAKVLGKSVRPVTKVGDDISSEYLAQMTELGLRVDDMIIKGVKTTQVWVNLTEDERQGGVIHLCDEIKPADVADLLKAVLINPGLWEVPWETLAAISAESIAVDAQGFVRGWHRDGGGDTTNLLQRWSDAGVLKRYKVLEATEEELRDFTGERDSMRALEKVLVEGPEVAIATQGGICFNKNSLLKNGNHAT